LVWLIFPTRRSVRVCLPDGTTFTVPPDGVLDGGTVLPEFTVPLRDLFAAQ
jgi:hypothetical protein